jgi:hypothetical protein
VGAEVTMRIEGAGFWSNPRIYPWLAAPFLIVAALFFAARRGRRATRAASAPGAVAVESAPFAMRGAGSPHAIPPTDDEFAAIYLFLIDALDRGMERGEFSRESYDLVRNNMKRRLASILADQPRTGTR